MASVYKVAIGHDQAGSLAALEPQPSSRGPEYPETVYTVAGDPVDRGRPFIDLNFQPDISFAESVTVLAALGLLTMSGDTPTGQNDTANITLAIPAHALRRTADFVNYNGVAVLPRSGRGGFDVRRVLGSYSGFTVRVRDLEALT